MPLPDPKSRYKAQGTDPRWKFVQQVVLPVYEDPDGPGEDGIYAPPGRVLTVSVVADRVFLSVAKYEETNKTQTLTDIVSESLSAEALLNALCMQMGVEWVQGLLRPQHMPSENTAYMTPEGD